MTLKTDFGSQPSNLPNLRRLFVEARSEAEESAYSRKAVCFLYQYQFGHLVG